MDGFNSTTSQRLTAFFASFQAFLGIGVEELAGRAGLDPSKARSSLWRMLNGLQPWKRDWAEQIARFAAERLNADLAVLRAALLGDARLPDGPCAELTALEFIHPTDQSTDSIADRLSRSLDVGGPSVEWHATIPSFLLTSGTRATRRRAAAECHFQAQCDRTFIPPLVDELHDRLMLTQVDASRTRVIASPESAWRALFDRNSSTSRLPPATLIDTLTFVLVDLVIGRKCGVLLLDDAEVRSDIHLRPCLTHDFIALYGHRLFKRRTGNEVVETTKARSQANCAALAPYLECCATFRSTASIESHRTRTTNSLLTWLEPLSPDAAARIRLLLREAAA